MGKPIDLTGQRFGKWTVVSKSTSPAGYEHQQFWLCRCDCGTEHVRKGGQLRWAEKKGLKQSCQRCAATNHGMTDTPEFIAWNSMNVRCKNPSHKFFHRYGGRGIKICERWSEFVNFYADMGPRPTKFHSLDRIDNNLGYSPENCRWVTQRMQKVNQERTVMISHNGKTQCMMDWSIETGISHAVIWHRINKLGWSDCDAVSIKNGKSFNWRGTSHKDAKKYEANGQSHTLKEWGEILKLHPSSLSGRIKRGWTIDRVFSHQASLGRAR